MKTRTCASLTARPGLQPAVFQTKIEGGPNWINSDEYTVEAETEGNGDIPNAVMAGPMTQVLLEDRFQLKIHHEKRDTPVYDLTVAKGGSKIQPAKITRCIAADFSDLTIASFVKDDLLRDERKCILLWNNRKGPDVIIAVRSKSMDEFTTALSHLMDRPVIDNTGITGDVDLRLLFWTRRQHTCRRHAAELPDGVLSTDPPGPSIFTAIQRQLGPETGTRKSSPRLPGHR